MHNNAARIFHKHGKKFFRHGMRVLEIGPESFPSTTENIINDPTIVWDTLDIKTDSRLTYQLQEEYSFTIPDNTYDIVFAAQVVEHVRKPWIWMKELTRICRSAGLVILTCPVSWPYHAWPVDCWRIYPEGMKALYEEAGLTLLVGITEGQDGVIDTIAVGRKGYLLADNTAPYTDEPFHPEIGKSLPQGWFSNADITEYRRLVRELPYGATMVEVGVWLGRSLCSVADIIKEKNINVHAVDIWEGKINLAQLYAGTPEEMMRECQQNCLSFGLTPTFYRMTSKEASEIISNAQLVFLDADHQYKSLQQDIQMWLPKTQCVLCGHDFYPHGHIEPGVYAAVKKMFKTVTVGGTVWSVRVEQGREGA